MFGHDDKILVYPVDRDILSVVKSTANFPSICIDSLVSPESWGYGGESYLCSNKTIDISHCYKTSLRSCNVVWIVDSFNDLDFFEYIEPAIRLAIKEEKRVIISRDICEREKKAITNISIEYVEYSSYEPKVDISKRIQEIRTPVIYVLSSTKYCNQFYIETALYTELINRDYSVVLVSSQKEGVVFNGYSPPDFMFNGLHNENEKIIAFNWYIRHLEMKNQPEVFIIGVPGSSMLYNQQFSSDFGVLAYEYSEAVKPDFAILSSPCMMYDEKYFNGVEKNLQGRLGIDIDIHSISPYSMDFGESSIEKSMSYFSVDDSIIQDIIGEICIEKLINLNSMSGVSIAIDKMINKLSSSASSLII